MTESCRLVTTEQYKEYQLLKKKLAIAVNILQKFAFDYDDKTKQRVFIENSLIALKEIEEVKKC